MDKQSEETEEVSESDSEQFLRIGGCTQLFELVTQQQQQQQKKQTKKCNANKQLKSGGK